MPRFAAIDVGSNASRLLIVDARDPERLTTFRSSRVPVRLGHSVFQTGRLDPEAIDHCVAAMHEFSEAMREAQVDAYRAIVTASARGASNADVLLHRVKEEADITLTAVDGLEEARLVAVAVKTRMSFTGHTLLMDLGGGSLELSELTGEDPGFTVSLPIGTVRLLEAFLKRGGTVTDAQDQLVREYLDRILAPHVRNLRAKPWRAVVGTGGNFETIARLCPGAKGPLPTIDVHKAALLRREMAKLTARERGVRYGLREDRADVILPALYVLEAMAKLTRVGRVVAPGVGLKEGIVTELVEKHYRVWDYGGERDKLFAAALALGRRYHFDERHATQVASLALDLFDGTQKIHGYGADERGFLRLAALLHDVGDFINPSAHHKHTQYIIENSDLMGISHEAKELVALVARYHRKSTPTLRHLAFRGLSPTDREKVKTLSGILRVADALDRGHRSKITALRIGARQGRCRIEVTADEDASLEVWTVARKSAAFEAAIGREIEVEVVDANASVTEPRVSTVVRTKKARKSARLAKRAAKQRTKKDRAKKPKDARKKKAA